MYHSTWSQGRSTKVKSVMRAANMEPGVHTMSDELIPHISCNIFLAFKWILMMTSGQNISHYTTAELSVHVWNHDLIWWQNKIDTQKHFHKTTITSSWTLSKTKIPITIVKAQMPSNPNQKSRIRDNENFKLKLCPCAQSHALGTRTKLQLEFLIINVITGIVYSREIISKRSGNVSETTPGAFATAMLTWMRSVMVSFISRN